MITQQDVEQAIIQQGIGNPINSAEAIASALAKRAKAIAAYRIIQNAEMLAALEAFMLFGEYVDQHNGMTIDMLFPERFAEARRVIDKAKGQL